MARIHIGDTVRFLNAVGGGIVCGFKGKELALVEDEDGFEVPVLLKECVVIQEGTSQSGKPMQQGEKHNEKKSSKQPRAGKPLAYVNEDEHEFSEVEVPIIEDRPEERRGADRLNLYLAYIPEEGDTVSSKALRAILVNDSNYYMYFTYQTLNMGRWEVVTHGLIDPNSQLDLEVVLRTELLSREHVLLQGVAFKVNKPFEQKEAIDCEIKMDMKKFYKLHAYRVTPFFREAVLLFPIIEDDHVVESIEFDPEEVAKEMQSKSGDVWHDEITKPTLKVVGHIDLNATKSGKRKGQLLKDVDIKQGLSNKKQSKSSKHAPIEVDLHMNALLDDYDVMDAQEMLGFQMDTFHRTMALYKNKRETTLVFIHGKGDGTLRQRILDALKMEYPTCVVQDASFRKYGYGATKVTIK